MQLECVWRQTGKQPADLANAPELPSLVEHLWQWFVDIGNTERQNNGMGISRITSADIRNWCWATGNRPEKWEIAVIKRLDVLWITSQPEPEQPK